MSSRRHQHNDDALKAAWQQTQPADSAALFWGQVQRAYAQQTGCAPGVARLQQAANRRGYRARIAGRSRSISRWQRIIIDPYDRASMAEDARGL